MDYTQLNIGGKLRGLKFNQMAYVLFYQHIDIAEYMASMYYAVIYGGLKANAYVKREEFTESFETVCDWIDDMSAEDKEAALKVFTETSRWQKIVEDGKAIVIETEEEKKSEVKSIMTSV